MFSANIYVRSEVSGIRSGKCHVPVQMSSTCIVQVEINQFCLLIISSLEAAKFDHSSLIIRRMIRSNDVDYRWWYRTNSFARIH